MVGADEAPATTLLNGACGDNGACAACIAKGIQQLIGMRRRCATAGAFRIVNKTGRAVVVRSKYKDVWEGEQWRLVEGGEMVVPPHILKHGDPYSRLGAVIDNDPSGNPHPLYIGSQHFLAGRGGEITLTLSASPSPSLTLSASPSPSPPPPGPTSPC